MPLMEFIPYVDNILTKNNGVIYINKRNSEGLFCNVKIDTNNYKNQIRFSSLFIILPLWAIYRY